MRKRLSSVSRNWSIRRGYFPILQERAGQQLTTQDTAVMMVYSINKYCKEKSSDLRGSMLEEIPQYLDALIDDGNFVREVVDFIIERA